MGARGRRDGGGGGGGRERAATHVGAWLGVGVGLGLGLGLGFRLALLHEAEALLVERVRVVEEEVVLRRQLHLQG